MLIKVGNYLINPEVIECVAENGASPKDEVTVKFSSGTRLVSEMILTKFQTIVHGIKKPKAAEVKVPKNGSPAQKAALLAYTLCPTLAFRKS